MHICCFEVMASKQPNRIFRQLPKVPDQAPVVQKLDSPIHRINHYPVDNAIGFPNTYPLASGLPGIVLSNL